MSLTVAFVNMTQQISFFFAGSSLKSLTSTARLFVQYIQVQEEY